MKVLRTCIFCVRMYLNIGKCFALKQLRRLLQRLQAGEKRIMQIK